MILLWSAIFATLVGFASAVLSPRDSDFNTLTQDQVDATDLYAHYASAAKCHPETLIHWNCGIHCQATPNFEFNTTGGTGDGVPYWFVGYDKAINSIIVAHQGTDKKKFFADLTDAGVTRSGLNPFIFPNISSDVTVHDGFASDQADTAFEILSPVINLLQTYPSATVTAIGHSVGAALALLDAVSFRLQLAPTTNISVIGYGMPRVGNQDFANFVDTILPGGVKRITNKHDPIPIVPGKGLGYHHVSGEIHIQQTGEWIACAGQDNKDSRCIVGAVSSIFHAKFSDHSGPYNNIMLNCDS